MVNITVLDNEENFLQFLDPELCTITETIEKDGLRTISFEYKFQDMVEDKKLFRIGNKLWIYGDSNLTDCLYVINTSVVQDIYQENVFKCEMEEVLVELNYAPLFTQNELTSQNGFTFSTNSGNNEYSVVVNWQALEYWFSDYFNIGVVQKCLSDYNAKIGISGTINLMTLLRKIEEETGNVFVTRYEKDCLNNTIHRYLDFLNPINVSKPWVLNLDYQFLEIDNTNYIFDDDDNPYDDTYEDVEDEDDIVLWDDDYTVETNLDPTNTSFRITNGIDVLGTDGNVYTGDDPEIEPLLWDGSDIPTFEDDAQSAIISLQKEKDYIGITVNEKSWVLLDDDYEVGDAEKAFVTIENSIEEGNKRSNAIIPDDSIFEIYDTVNQRPVFQTRINREIGHVHEEILDFGFNLENIELEIDETETYTAISPILYSEDEEGLSRTNMSDLIDKWQNLSVTKGDVVPMIVERINVKASSLSAAISSLGTYSVSSNYYRRPYKPNDQIDSQTPSNSTWEFWRGTAYWRAPYTKVAGQLHVTTDAVLSTQYLNIHTKPDGRDDRDTMTSRPKMGTLETTNEDIYGIFNMVCNTLREKQAPGFNLKVDVANLRNGEYNNYDLHDKVYIKIPEMAELLTARVVKTEKESHDVAKNTIELSNYSVNTVKQIQSNTFIEASNVSFKYPKKVNYQVRLVNEDYDSSNPDSIQYPANKLLTFHKYKVDENGTTTPTKTTYTKVTDANGYVTIPLKYDPGDYELHIGFGGDEEYLDCSMTVQVNVSGTKEVKKASSGNTKSKVAKDTKVSKKSKYWSKYGVSPDGKQITAIGKSNSKYYKTVFNRKCPVCGSKELYWSIFWSGNENKDYGTFPTTGTYESGSKSGAILCSKCNSKFNALGVNTAGKDLSVAKKKVKSSKTEAYTLKKGKLPYNTEKKTTKPKKVTSTKTRQISNVPSAYVKKKALNIVGDSTGLAAAKKIVAWVDKNIKYELYANFHRSPDTVIKKRKANCCDQARTVLTLCDAAGCTEFLTLKYVHVHKAPNRGHVFCKIITNSTGNWRYVDTCKWGGKAWGHYVHGYGSPPGRQTTYPTKPFN